MPFCTKVDNLIEEEFEDKTRNGGEELKIDKKVEVVGHFLHQFKSLRINDGITTQNLLESLDPDRNASCVFKAGEASGASGSFFFFSKDKHFIIKTMSQSEKEFFLKNLAMPYFEHLRKNPTSLLARIYGFYTVRIAGLSPVHIMLMAHTMQVSRPDHVSRVFDLKGSTVDRSVRFTKSTSGLKTLKDENFVQINNKSNSVNLIKIFESERAFI